MREPPRDPSDASVLDAVRGGWQPEVERVEYLPVGFGAHHWAAYVGPRPRLFVTFDPPGQKSRDDLTASYAGARALREAGLDFVVAPLPTHDGPTGAVIAGGLLTCTPWCDGTSEPPLDISWTTAALQRLHAAPPPPGGPHWSPKVDPDFATSTAVLVDGPWGPGPYADDARHAVRRHLGDLETWTDRYHHLAGLARDRPWVACHGEPHHANQLLTARGRVLVDWDTLRLAPAELDLRVLVENGVGPDDAGADREMLELFDLEWRLDEVSQYAAWFAAPHTGGADDVIAIGGLHHELGRPAPRWE